MLKKRIEPSPLVVVSCSSSRQKVLGPSLTKFARRSDCSDSCLGVGTVVGVSVDVTSGAIVGVGVGDEVLAAG